MRAWISPVEGDALKFKCRARNTVALAASVYNHMKGKIHKDNFVAYMATYSSEDEADDE
jgi:hypothetical protein